MANGKHEGDKAVLITFAGPSGQKDVYRIVGCSDVDRWVCERRVRDDIEKLLADTMVHSIRQLSPTTTWVLQDAGQAYLVAEMATATEDSPPFRFWQLPRGVNPFEALAKAELKGIDAFQAPNNKLEAILQARETAPLQSTCETSFSGLADAKSVPDASRADNQDNPSATDRVLETLDVFESWVQELPEELSPEPRRLIGVVRDTYKAAKRHTNGLINSLGQALESFEQQAKRSSEQLRKQQSADPKHPADGT